MGDSATASGFSAQSRTLRNSVISLVVFCLLVVALLLGVPGLRTVAHRIEHANLAWIAVGGGLELLSCAGYVVLFELVFNNLDRHLTSRLSLSELAVNSAVSASGVGGIALGAWVLRSKGVSVERIAKRSVLIFMLTSAVNVGAVALIGLPMWLGWLPGSRRELLTLIPALVSIALILGTLAVSAWARKAAARRPLEHGRMAVALAALSGGIDDAVELIRHPNWRLLGAVGYWLFDNLALYACLVAFGHAPSVWAVGMAYLVGLLANSIPIPGGFGVVEGGLVGMLVLFGSKPAALALAAVLTFRAISLWIPATIGIAAFLSLRREIGEPLTTSEPLSPPTEGAARP
jgi:uncharacterized membrane protein YbhN (UPF0104 family)